MACRVAFRQSTPVFASLWNYWVVTDALQERREIWECAMAVPGFVCPVERDVPARADTETRRVSRVWVGMV